MDGPMKLLVYSIAAIVIISILVLYIFPMFFPEANNLAIFENNLKAAETGLGVGFTNELELKQGDGFGGETFDSLTRNIIFQCNSSTLCCPQGQECDLAIEWDSKMVKFNKTKTITTTIRCGKEYTIYTCTIYFGKRPAQIEIDSLESPKEVDLGKEQPTFEITFSNTGGLDALQTTVEIEVFRRYLEEGRWIEKRIEKVSKVENFGELGKGESKTETIEIELNENGLFKTRVRASGLEAGFDEKIVQFNATGANTGCVASYCEDPRLIEENCIVRCHCESCLFGSNCTEKLSQADNVTLGLIPELNLENAEPTVLGSNIVDFKVPEIYCQEIVPVPDNDAPDDTVPDPDDFDPYNIDPNYTIPDYIPPDNTIPDPSNVDVYQN